MNVDIEMVIAFLGLVGEAVGPYALTALALRLTQTILTQVTLVWLTRGADPVERALIIAAARMRRRSWLSRARGWWLRIRSK